MNGFVFIFIVVQNHIGENYKIIYFQTECSFYQILYSHY